MNILRYNEDWTLALLWHKQEISAPGWHFKKPRKEEDPPDPDGSRLFPIERNVKGEEFQVGVGDKE